MILDFQNMVKASKLAHIDKKLSDIFLKSMNDKSSFYDIEYLNNFKIKENKIYKYGGFLNTLTFIGYCK